ncbi:ATP-dependent RNA helicase DHX8 [Rhexocercosporidium sp. MPI-PUGE-AT-0058]|nr:ATP-dependent RNA helicase DHX8 [Rhexocercosporidium sp. MPI-PUGE-AT-0058]
MPSSSAPSAPTMASSTASPAAPAAPMTTPPPYRQIRALYDAETVTVYQAYSRTIAEAAVREQRLDASPDFICGQRMTWIKPSWCWMMYRSGYASKDLRQTHILALRLTHATFKSLLLRASLSSNHSVPSVPLTPEEKNMPVRVQWDPERSPRLERLGWRSLQVGISGTLVNEWVSGGIVSIEDVSERARRLGEWVENHKGEEGEWERLVEEGLVPRERVYEVDEEVRGRLGMD